MRTAGTRTWWGIVALIGLWGLAAPAGAQTVLNPNRVQFESPDHATVLQSGDPAITRYELRIYPTGAQLPLSVHDLGKPAPAADNMITITVPALIGIPVDQLFTAKVAAMGPGGATESEASNPFLRATAARAPVKVVVLP